MGKRVSASSLRYKEPASVSMIENMATRGLTHSKQSGGKQVAPCSWGNSVTKISTAFYLMIASLISLGSIASSGPIQDRIDPRTDGTWRAEGYGLLRVIQSGKSKTYNVTSISCIPVSENWEGLEEYKEVRLNDAGDRLTLYHRDGNIYVYSRQPGLPPACSNYAPSKDPELNFEVFWNTFEQDYAFFHVNKVDWQAMYKIYRPQVNKGTTDDELLEYFRQMVAPLKDAHVYIVAGDKRVGHSGYELRSKRGQVWDLVQEKYLKGEYKTRLNQLSYGRLDDKTGYLKVAAMSGFTRHYPMSNAETVTLIEQAMDEIIASFNGLEKVVIDVRFNGGGEDEYSRAIIQRFTDRRRLAYSKQPRHGGYTEYGQKAEFYLEPRGPRQFTGKVVVLANGATVSAAEIFMLCVQALPHMSIVGENTEGAFSDNLIKTLPNGWRLSLSNEVYYNYKGVCLEGQGVAPDVRVPLTLKDLEEKRDLALEKAMAM